MFDYDAERKIFQKTFRVLRGCLGSESFYMVVRRSSGTQSKYPFSVLHYEAFTLGVQSHLGNIDPEDAVQMEKLKLAASAIKNDDEFIRLTTGGGKNTKGSLVRRVQFVSDRIGRAL